MRSRDAAGVPATASMTRAEAWALAYIALPTVIFLAGWIVLPVGPIAATLLALAVFASVVGRRSLRTPPLGPLIVPVVAIAGLWCVLAGVGHLVFANADWVVRDGVLVDLVGKPWAVNYVLDGVVTLMRAPIGYFLPAALVGKVWGIHAAEYALLGWTLLGVVLVFVMMLRDRPPLKAAVVRIAIFVAFSGMDILGQIAHYNPHPLGEHLEWWAFIFQYSSLTTQLFWVPNHALPGWIAIAWLLGQNPRRLPITPAVLFIVFAPLWSPLTAIGIAPIVGVALVRRIVVTPPRLGELVDWKMFVPVAACCLLVFPYLVAGSSEVRSGGNAEIRWVGEDLVPRIVEFVLFEFAGFAVLLLARDRRDPVLWAAVLLLLVLPWYRFGPYNDLAMRASIPALVLLAIRLGHWLSTPFAKRESGPRLIAIALLAIGAVTPFMEIARVFIEPRWEMNAEASLPDVTRGTHYLTPLDKPWLLRFVRLPDADRR